MTVEYLAMSSNDSGPVAITNIDNCSTSGMISSWETHWSAVEVDRDAEDSYVVITVVADVLP